MNLRLVSAGPDYHSDIIEAMDESGDEIYQAMPWLVLNEPIPSQVEEYLADVQRFGAGGLAYHWAILSSDEFAGLIALDYTPNLIEGHWNLGYWIRPRCQRKGIANQSIDAVLDWIGRGGLTSVEISVNPVNLAGVRTAESTVRRWRGHQLENKIPVEVSGQWVIHDCWLIPRLPLEDSQ